jgi:hypothetical protein
MKRADALPTHLRDPAYMAPREILAELAQLLAVAYVRARGANTARPRRLGARGAAVSSERNCLAVASPHEPSWASTGNARRFPGRARHGART